MPAPTPTIPARVLTADAGSPMRFMAEAVVWDLEVGSPVRFREPFVMPSWEGVTENEDDYVVDSPSMRLDILSLRYYSRSDRGWVIAARNGMDLPDVQLYVGRLLKIPRREWVERKLLPQGS
ncbi:MAG: hypothetical protein WC683_01610 [bacterium]